MKRTPLKLQFERRECWCLELGFTRVKNHPSLPLYAWFSIRFALGHWHGCLLVMTRPKTTHSVVSEAIAQASGKNVVIPFPKQPFSPSRSAQSYSSN